MPDQFATMLTDIAKAAEEASPMRASSVIRRRGDQRRTRQRAAVGVLSAVAVGAIVATGSFVGMHRTANNLPAIEPSTSASAAATAGPTATASPSSASASPADLTLSAGQILTNGSSGNIEGTVQLSVQNRGPAAVDRIDLTFVLTSGVQPTGTTWTGCVGPDAHQSVTCSEPAPAVGASRDYAFQLAIVTEKLRIGSNRKPILPSVTAQPHGTTDVTPADDTVMLTMCTNGCSQLSVTITGPASTTVMTLGGKEADFTVTITNPTGQAFSKIYPLVYAGSCTCTESPIKPMAPVGTMKVKQSDGSWKPVDYSREGTGMDFVGAKQVPAFTLAPGATVSFTYRIGFSATQTGTYHSGDLQLGVMMLALPGYTAVGPTRDAGGGGITILGRDASPLAFVPIHVTTN